MERFLKEHNFNGTHNVRPSGFDFVPIGSIMAWPSASIPDGWLLCDGSQISRTTYQALFNIIGTTFGTGDGSTTFNLPDARQRFIIGLAASGTGSVLGGTGGNIDHTHSGGAHTHTISSDGGHTHTGGAHTHTISTDGAHGHTVDAHSHNITSDGAHTHSGSTGSDGSHNHTGTVDAQTDGQTVPVPGGVQAFSASNPNHQHDFTTSTDGAHTHTISSDGSHNHDGSTDNTSPGTNSQGDHDHTGSTGSAGAVATSSDGAHTHGGVTGSSSGTTGTANPPFIALNVIILAGV